MQSVESTNGMRLNISEEVMRNDCLSLTRLQQELKLAS